MNGSEWMNESASGLIRSAGGLVGHVVSSDADGSVSFIVQHLRFLPLICLVHHHHLSFTYLVHHSVYPFAHGSVSSTSSQLISMFSTAQITGVIHRLEYRWTMLSGSALVNYVKIPVRSVLCVCIGSTFPTLSTTPRGTRIYVNILYVSCRWLVNKTTTIISFCFVLWRTNAQLFYKLSHFIYLFVVNWTIMMF